MKWFSDWLDILYPPRCPGCGKSVSKNGNWCRDCFTSFWNPRLLSGSRTRELEGCYALGNYRGGLRKCIIDVKFEGQLSRGLAFQRLLEQFPWWDRITADWVVPIALSEKRWKERGYNQTDAMFQLYLEGRGLIYENALVRIRHTETQSKLSREERQKNVRGAFHVRRGLELKSYSILLVDDVYTTGATMKEAARELKRAGASSVTGMVIASGAD